MHWEHGVRKLQLGNNLFGGSWYGPSVNGERDYYLGLDECFMGCRSLVCVMFVSHSCLKRIGKKAFLNCDNIRELEIPGSIEEIGDECFSPYVRFNKSGNCEHE